MRTLAEALAMSGLAARGTLLPGHGTHPDDLREIVWQDWYEHIHEEYSELKRKHEEVFLVGFSIGAALSAYYAAHNQVDRLILLNVPLCPLNGRFPTGLMLRLYGAIFKEVKGRPERLIDADGEPFHFVYDRVPTSILHTMSELVGIARKSLGRIRSPVLIIQSKNDNVSGGKSGPLAYRRVRSREKSLVMLDSSDHSIMAGAERDVVFGKVIGFLNGESSK
jgi:carboxylesterase